MTLGVSRHDTYSSPENFLVVCHQNIFRRATVLDDMTSTLDDMTSTLNDMTSTLDDMTSTLDDILDCFGYPHLTSKGGPLHIKHYSCKYMSN